MSKVIKAKEPSSVALFDFRVINESHIRGENVEGGTSPDKENPSSDKVSDDHSSLNELTALEELEMTIQGRLLEAETRARELEKEGYERGFSQGEKQGLEFARKSMLPIKEDLKKLLEGISKAPEDLFAQYREWFIGACISVARRIVGMELKINTGALTDTIEKLLGEMEKHQSLTLHINPEDLEVLNAEEDMRAWIKGKENSLNFTTDHQIERGGFRIESEIQFVDATIENRFAQLERILKQHDTGTD